MLANSWRPRTIGDFYGQDHITYVVQTMLQRWRDGEISLPPGIILTGPRGAGKTSLARVIAAALNCSAAGLPCTQCSHCQAIYRQTSDCVLEIDGATSGLVDDVRHLKTLTRLSHSGQYRVIIVDECHAMSREAQSALLKQLEEPPPEVLYVLVTTDFTSIQATVVSRCLTFVYNSIDVSDIVARLVQVCDAEGFAYETSALELIARQSNGAMRDALMKLEHLSIINEVTQAKAAELWPDDLDAFAASFMASVFSADQEQAMAAIHATFQIHRDPQQMVDAVVRWLRDEVREGAPKSLSLRKIADLMERAWNLRVALRGNLHGDKTLVEMLWYVFVKDLGTAPSDIRRTTPQLQVVQRPSAPVHTNGVAKVSEADLLKDLADL